jgi:hypothetical protein
MLKTILAFACKPSPDRRAQLPSTYSPGTYDLSGTLLEANSKVSGLRLNIAQFAAEQVF